LAAGALDGVAGVAGVAIFASVAVFSAFVPVEVVSVLACVSATAAGFGLSVLGASAFGAVLAVLDVFAPVPVCAVEGEVEDVAVFGAALAATEDVDDVLAGVAGVLAASAFTAGLAFFAVVLRAGFGLAAAVDARDVGFSAGFSPLELGVFAFATLRTFPILVISKAVFYNLRQHLGWSSR
tara:strand:- start:151194 stop:151736 length:543 start_codon:yes stop_codon:yes gene_type:complete